MILFFVGIVLADSVAVNRTQLAIVETIINTLNEYSNVVPILADQTGVLCPSDSPAGGILMCNQWGDIDSIHAPGLELRGNFSDTDFSGLVNLTFINFANNSLYGTISPSIRNLKKLRFIYLQQNELTGRIDSFLFSNIQTTLSVCVLFGGQTDRNCFEDEVDTKYAKCNWMSKNTQLFCNPALIGTSTPTLPGSRPQSTPLALTTNGVAIGSVTVQNTNREENQSGSDVQTGAPQDEPDVMVIAICGTIAGVICIVSMLLLGWWVGKKGRKRPDLSQAIGHSEEIPDVDDGIPDDNYVSIPVTAGHGGPTYDKVLPRNPSGYTPAPAPNSAYKSVLSNLK